MGRLDRLYNDQEAMGTMHQRGGLIYLITARGDPAEHYVVGFHCRGVAEIDAADRPVLRDDHRVELVLTADYPRMRPMMRWLTPIFHPNFDGRGGICINEWYPQLTLCELCEVLAEMVQYKNYNTTSPLNMDAAMWAMRHRDELPIDDRDLFAPAPKIPQPAPLAQAGRQPPAVVTGMIPIWSPQEPAEPEEELARFCGRCGHDYHATDARACPACGAARSVL